ncbi:hypothetical protein [Methylobacterium radiotolerans]|uniref:hypothetical protein n=1 Tax=Methylobacterium radiotolerans TaxID=31998 RepID=UPI0015F68AE1|nr:hypothetical protein [Methylobacterium radiotolerans]
MPEVRPRLDADGELYAAADKALRTLRADLLRRAGNADDYRMVVEFGERLLRYSTNTIAKVSGYPTAAEHAYRAADELVAASSQEASR